MNKYLIYPLLLILFLASCTSNDFVTKFSFVPESPKVGEEITIKYKTELENLKGAQSLEMIVYSFGSDLMFTDKVALVKKGEGWIGKFKTSENVNGLLIKFMDGELIDNNSEMGFVIKLNDAEGNEIKGVKAGVANVYYRWGRNIGLMNDKDSINKYFTEEFKINPELKRKYLSSYLGSTQGKNIDSIAFAEIEWLERQTDLEQEDYEFLASWTRQVGDHVKSLKYIELIEQKYPTAKIVKSKYYNKFRNMVTIERKLEVFNELNSFIKESDVSTYMLNSIVNQQIEENKLADAKKLLDEYSFLTTSNLYNSISWKMFESKNNLNDALLFCGKGVSLGRNEVKTPTGEKPVYLTDEEWQESKSNSLGMILDTYGSIKKELGDKEEALKFYEEAVDITKSEFPDVNENYTSLLYELGQNEKAKVKIEEFIANGKSTDNMKNMLGELFGKLNLNKEEFESYLGEVKTKEDEKLKEKLKHELINKPAPKFTLLDLEGNTVNLTDFSGKTVIVDFWATWCGPCLQSFPIMQKAVNKYSSDESVKFLFVNTWERVEDKLKNAKEFMERSKYPFHVLMDENNEVIEKYGVEGIPTKFIVDKNGNIRFKSVGLEGSETEVLAEIDQMILMVK